MRLVLHENDKGTIAEKIAYRLADNLSQWGVEAELGGPCAMSDVNHWMNYSHFRDYEGSRHTLSILHMDSPAEVLLVRDVLQKAQCAFCASQRILTELIASGIAQSKLLYILPAHDVELTSRRIVMGITSRRRPDSMKREDVLLKLADTMRLDAFHFVIIGRGWEPVIPKLQEAGASVNYFPGSEDSVKDYEINLNQVPKFDYYLYLGWDEGSMGFLDALAAGVPTIVTPQGFHLDVNGGITHSFSNLQELKKYFHRFAQDRNARIDSVAHLTFSEYARVHAQQWRACKEP